jgi:biopolymer transport protein ExbD
VQQIFSLGLREDGTTHVDGVVTTGDEDVLHKAKASLLRHPELRAVVQADGNVPHRRVMHALDILRQAGLARVAFGVQLGPAVNSEANPEVNSVGKP